jgi:hypothetical protein
MDDKGKAAILLLEGLAMPIRCHTVKQIKKATSDSFLSPIQFHKVAKNMA